MRVVTLVEKTALSSQYETGRGICLYIETKTHKILFDLGENEVFLRNARKLGVEIADVDTVVISHGHAVHAGGLEAFLTQNEKARIYVRESAFEPHFIRMMGIPFDVGLDSRLKSHPRIIFTDVVHRPDDTMTLFADVSGNDCYSPANAALCTRRGNNQYEDDLFEHEQSLLLKEEGRYVLIGGCAHKGIVNIKRRAEEIAGRSVDCVVSGFHLYNQSTDKYAPNTAVIELGRALRRQKETQYYTCHCTGPKAYDILKNVMGKQIRYLRAGREIEV